MCHLSCVLTFLLNRYIYFFFVSFIHLSYIFCVDSPGLFPYLFILPDAKIEKDVCPSEQFTCNSNGECIPMSWVCDGNPDCSNESDEQACSKCYNGNFLLQKFWFLKFIIIWKKLFLLFFKFFHIYENFVLYR